MERTLAIVKPDAVAAGLIGEIFRRIEQEGLRPAGIKMDLLTRTRAEGFYYLHKGKPFFDSLMAFMTSGPCVIAVLEGHDAIARWRALMGSTDPRAAAPGTIRHDMATNVERNAVHGSDGADSASYEIAYFFRGTELFGG